MITLLPALWTAHQAHKHMHCCCLVLPPPSQVAKVDELSKLHKERRRHQLALQSGKPEKRRKEHKEGGKRQRDEDGAGSGSDSGSSSGSESGSGSESESSSSGSEDERSRRKSGSKRRRSRSRERSSKRSKKEKRSSKDKKRKKEKRSKKEKKEKRGSKDKARAKQATRVSFVFAAALGLPCHAAIAGLAGAPWWLLAAQQLLCAGLSRLVLPLIAPLVPTLPHLAHPPCPAALQGAIGHEYGKYGLIRETDMYTKRPEFQLWAMEVG